MATEKVSLTLDEKTLRQARRRVGDRGLSKYVEEAVSLRLQHERIRSLLAEMEAESGPIPAKVMEEARREWQRGTDALGRLPRTRKPRRS